MYEKTFLRGSAGTINGSKYTCLYLPAGKTNRETRSNKQNKQILTQTRSR